MRESIREEMASEQIREELEAKARQGETVVPGGTGGKSFEAQEHLAEGKLCVCVCHACAWRPWSLVQVFLHSNKLNGSVLINGMLLVGDVGRSKGGQTR